MEFVEYMKIKKRMTKTDFKDTCGLPCDECPFNIDDVGSILPCHGFEMLYPEKAEAIVQKWAEEHPQKTILQEFLEHYPNVSRHDNGVPKICPHVIGYKNIYEIGTLCTLEGCEKCWNQPVAGNEG